MPSKTPIRFPCKCGHRFEVPIDRAGDAVQCPQCGLLADIPTLTDLENIDAADGTVRMTPVVEKEEPGRLAELTRLYDPHSVDGQGTEKDLRASFEDLQRAGVEPIPFSEDQTFAQVAPKYDPETGELVEPIAVGPACGGTPGEPSGPIPVATRSLSYASGEQALHLTPGRVMLELCMPGNIVVAVFLLGFHLVLQGAALLMIYGLFFAGIGVIVVLMLVFAHYANVIEETGPENRDELPRPLRSVSLGEDIWHPFVRFSVALALCFWPVALVAANGLEGLLSEPSRVLGGLALTAAVFLAGSIVFPAVLLTVTTSGAYNNLRPARVLSVIRAGGRRYLIAMLTWLIAGPCYLAALFVMWVQLVNLVQPVSAPRLAIGHWGVVYPALFVAIYGMHLFGWQLGLIYRHHHAEFKWVFQRHISKRQALEAQRARQYRGSAQLTRDVATARRLQTHGRS